MECFIAAWKCFTIIHYHLFFKLEKSNNISNLAASSDFFVTGRKKNDYLNWVLDFSNCNNVTIVDKTLYATFGLQTSVYWILVKTVSIISADYITASLTYYI